MSQAKRNYQPLVTLLILAVLSLGFVYVLMKPFLEPVFFAVVLAIAVSPLHRRIALRVRSQAGAAAITTFLLLLLVLLPILGLGIAIAREARTAYAALAAQSAQGGGWNLWLAHLLAPPVEWVAGMTGMPAPNVHQLVLDRATPSLAW
jgi:predicted PurR-regulated permease PerM